MCRFIIVFFIVFLCGHFNSCKTKHLTKNQIEQIESFFKRYGDDYISEKDLISLIKKAQLKVNRKIDKIEIYHIVPPVPPAKRGIEIHFFATQKNNLEIRRLITFRQVNILNTKHSIYLGREKYQDGKWYSKYEDGSILEENGVKWEDLGLSEEEYYKIHLDNGVVFYHQRVEDLTYEKIKSILLYLKSNYQIDASFFIRKIKDGYKVQIPSANDPYEGIWIKIIDAGNSYKVIDTGGYAI